MPLLTRGGAVSIVACTRGSVASTSTTRNPRMKAQTHHKSHWRLACADQMDRDRCRRSAHGLACGRELHLLSCPWAGRLVSPIPPQQSPRKVMLGLSRTHPFPRNGETLTAANPPMSFPETTVSRPRRSEAAYSRRTRACLQAKGGSTKVCS